MVDIDQLRRRRRRAIFTEVLCLAIFLVSATLVVVVIVVAWPWPLFAVLGVFVARASVEGILRPDSGEVDEPS